MSKAWFLCLLIICGCISQNAVSSSPAESSTRPETPDDSGVVAFNAESAIDSIKLWDLHKPADERFQELRVFPVPDYPHLIGAICDSIPGWEGTFGVYELRDGNVVWQAECEKQPTEQHVSYLKALKLAGFARPMIEVYGETHMGHGYFYLYELRNRTLVLLLQTFAVDGNPQGRETFQGGRLQSEYMDLNGDGIADLLLKGVVEEYPEDGAENADTIVATHPCQKVFLWNNKLLRFEEDRSRRIGLKDDNDR
jgi:hypothetical protein